MYISKVGSCWISFIFLISICCMGKSFFFYVSSLELSKYILGQYHIRSHLETSGAVNNPTCILIYLERHLATNHCYTLFNAVYMEIAQLSDHRNIKLFPHLEIWSASSIVNRLSLIMLILSDVWQPFVFHLWKIEIWIIFLFHTWICMYTNV